MDDAAQIGKIIIAHVTEQCCCLSRAGTAAAVHKNRGIFIFDDCLRFVNSLQRYIYALGDVPLVKFLGSADIQQNRAGSGAVGVQMVVYIVL